MAEFDVIEQELDKHGVYATRTTGTSMRPLFKTHRDMVIIEKPKGELEKYDVALYHSINGKEYVLHRVIAVREKDYVIRGDNTFVKEYVPKEAVVGVLTAFNRKGKRHSTDDLGFRVYSVIWNFIYPVRFVFRCFRNVLAKIYHKIFRKKN